MDLSLGGWGWWYGRYDPDPAAPEGEKWWGDNEGPGLTTGGVLRLNDDFDKSPDYEWTGEPLRDHQVNEFFAHDDELVPLWLGFWTDAPDDNLEPLNLRIIAESCSRSWSVRRTTYTLRMRASWLNAGEKPGRKIIGNPKI